MQLGGIVEYRLRYVERLCYLNDEKRKFKQEAQQQIQEYRKAREHYISQQRAAFVAQRKEQATAATGRQWNAWLAQVEDEWAKQDSAETKRIEDQLQQREEGWETAYKSEQRRQREAEEAWQKQINAARAKQGHPPIEISEIVSAGLRMVCGEEGVPTEDHEEVDALKDALTNAVTRIRAETKPSMREESKAGGSERVQGTISTQGIDEPDLEQVLRQALVQKLQDKASPDLLLRAEQGEMSADEILQHLVALADENYSLKGKLSKADEYQTQLADTAATLQLKVREYEENQKKREHANHVLESNHVQQRTEPQQAPQLQSLSRPTSTHLPAKPASLVGLAPDTETDEHQGATGNDKTEGERRGSVPPLDAFKEALKNALIENAAHQMEKDPNAKPPDTSVLNLSIEEFAALVVEKNQKHNHKVRATVQHTNSTASVPPQPAGVEDDDKISIRLSPTTNDKPSNHNVETANNKLSNHTVEGANTKPSNHNVSTPQDVTDKPSKVAGALSDCNDSTPEGGANDKPSNLTAGEQEQKSQHRPFSGVLQWREGVALKPNSRYRVNSTPEAPVYAASKPTTPMRSHSSYRSRSVQLDTPENSEPPSAPGTPESFTDDETIYPASRHHPNPVFQDERFSVARLGASAIFQRAPTILEDKEVIDAVYSELRPFGPSPPPYPRHLLKGLPLLPDHEVECLPDVFVETKIRLSKVDNRPASLKMKRPFPPIPPEPDPPDERLGFPFSELITVADIDFSKPPTMADNPKHNPPKPKWSEWKTKEGKVYFHNTDTKQSLWKRPLEMDQPKTDLFNCPKDVTFDSPTDGSPFIFGAQRKSGYIRLVNNCQTVDSRLGQGYACSSEALPRGCFEVHSQGDMDGGWIRVGVAMHDFSDFSVLDKWGFSKYRNKLGTTWFSNKITVSKAVQVRIVCNTNHSYVADNGIVVLSDRKIVYKALGLPIVEELEAPHGRCWFVVESQDAICSFSWAPGLPDHMYTDERDWKFPFMDLSEEKEAPTDEIRKQADNLRIKRLFKTSHDLWLADNGKVQSD